MSWKIAGKPDGSIPEVGKKYRVMHSRKGNFFMRVELVNGDAAQGVIVDGVAKMISGGDLEPGEVVSISNTLCTLIEASETILP